MKGLRHAPIALGLKRVSLLLLGGCLIAIAPEFHAQQDSSARRKIVARTEPAYPVLARSMALQGVVKLEAAVAADGTVRTVDIKGGHPVLAQAAANTIRNWKWEPATRESREIVEIRFSPPE